MAFLTGYARPSQPVRVETEEGGLVATVTGSPDDGYWAAAVPPGSYVVEEYLGRRYSAHTRTSDSPTAVPAGSPADSPRARAARGEQ